MKPSEYLETVVLPNVRELGEHQMSYRRAVNAILSLDAAFGQLHAFLVERADPFLETVATRQKGGPSDSDFREHFAQQDRHVRIVRDAAFATKHGLLTHGVVNRLVPTSQNIRRSRISIRDGFAIGRDPIGGSAVFIEVTDGPRIRARHACAPVYRFLKTRIVNFGA
jgi:hypothetical protein